MLRILTAAEMRAADARTIESGTPARVLMERAARAALDLLERHFDTTRVLFLCGSGNNGGDGLAMARFFAAHGGKGAVLYLGATNPDGTPDTAQMSEEAARQLSLLPPEIALLTELDTSGVSAVVDALLGTGLCRPLEGRYRETVERLNALSLPTLAIDLPSGLHTDTGAVMGAALRATRTVAIEAKKPCHLLFPGAELCGIVDTVSIGIDTDVAGTILSPERSDLSLLPPRPRRAHKGSFGRVLVIGGSVGMSGAAYFTAKAAYRTGAGLVEIFCPTENRVIYQTSLPEALLTLYDPDALDETALFRALDRADAVALGMGLTTAELTERITSLVLSHCRKPLLLDADALNVIAASPALAATLRAYPASLVLTPHLGEMSRLTARPIPEIAGNLVTSATALARATGATVVLKDAHTVTADGTRAYLNTYGNSGMATGGSGDVLAGVIASLLAQGAPRDKAAYLGVLCHALAGDAAAARLGNRSVMASDIIDGLCEVLS